MTWIILRRLNSLFFVLLSLIAVSIQSTVFHYPPLSYVQPDLILIFVIWCGLERNYFEGGILTLLFGYIAELHSSAPRGSFLLTYMLITMCVRFSKRYVLINQRKSLVLFCMSISILWKCTLSLLLWMLDSTTLHWKYLLLGLVPGALVQGFVAWPILSLLWKFDWLTFKNPRAASLLEDEVRLEGEGF